MILQIRNDGINDIFSKKSKLPLRESQEGVVFVDGLVETPVKTFEDAMQLLKPRQLSKRSEGVEISLKRRISHRVFRIVSPLSLVQPKVFVDGIESPQGLGTSSGRCRLAGVMS